MASACDLASRVRAAPHTAPNWAELNGVYSRMYDEMIAHEQKEHDLLQEVYTQDIGDKD